MFRTDAGQCELHDPGLKPTEGKMSTHKDTPQELHEAMAESWNNKEAQELATKWGDDHRAYHRDDGDDWDGDDWDDDDWDDDDFVDDEDDS